MYEETKRPGMEHIRMAMVKNGCRHRNVDRGIETSTSLASIHKTQRPTDYRPFDGPCLETASNSNKPIGKQVKPQNRPWNVYSPRATGITFYDVLTELAEHIVTAITNLTMEKRDSTTADPPTWLRAKKLMPDMCNICIEPVRQHMVALTHRLMATPGPNEGITFCSAIYEQQAQCGT